MPGQHSGSPLAAIALKRCHFMPRMLPQRPPSRWAPVESGQLPTQHRPLYLLIKRLHFLPYQGSSKSHDRRRPVGAPWGQILRSPAIHAIVVNNFTFHYALYILMNWMPTYFEELLGTLLPALFSGNPPGYTLQFAGCGQTIAATCFRYRPINDGRCKICAIPGHFRFLSLVRILWRLDDCALELACCHRKEAH